MKIDRLSLGAMCGVLFAATSVGLAGCGDDSGGGGTTVEDTGGGVDTLVEPDTSGGGETEPEETGETSEPVDTATTDGPPPDTKSDTVVEAGPPACPATPKEGKLAAFNDPASATKAKDGDGLKLTGVVATSGRVLISKAASGSCLFGIFVADESATFVPYSGILVVSFGDKQTTVDGGTVCTGGDLIPTDAKPGDKLDLIGKYDLFGPSATACGGTLPTPSKLPELGSLCSYKKTGTTTAILPADVTTKSLEAGSADVLKYANGLVRIKAVEATAAPDATTGLFPLKDTITKVSSKLYTLGGAPAPTVTVGTKFTEIVGEGYLDGCTWTIAPRTICDQTPIPGDGSKCK